MSGRGVITARESSLLLDVSEATVRNWVRHGYLSPAPGSAKTFYPADVLRLKKKLASGRIDRLRQRANKTRLRRTAVPAEYAGDAARVRQIEKIRDLYAAGSLDLERTVFVLAAGLLAQKEEVRLRDPADMFCARSFAGWRRRCVQDDMLDWLRDLAGRPADRGADYAGIFSALDGTTTHADLLGVLYQSLLYEGRKSSQGLYYTPADLPAGVFEDRTPCGGRFLDPCCGTGQFLIQAARSGKYPPEDLFGFDQDRIAVCLARINLLLTFPGQEFSPHIFCSDFLNPGAAAPFQERFRLIATNPPWGAALSPAQRTRLKKAYPYITSHESFSFFLAAGLERLEAGGRLSFILPESFLNIRAHRDIRAHLLTSATLMSVTFLGRRFGGVLSPAIRLDVKKTAPAKKARTRVVCQNGKTHTVPQARFLNNDNYMIDAGLDEIEAAIIRKIYAFPHVTLKGAADWALGIVTGDNRKYVADSCRKNMEPVYRGRDVEKYRLKTPAAFLRFMPEQFQQTAPESKYRAKEKLVYRFVSSRLVFALDTSGALTLNSANILIPELAGYPVKAVLGVLNSRLCQFVFSKKFQTHKVLRSDLESLPLPLLGPDRLNRLAEMVDRAMAGEDAGSAMDELIMTGLELSEKEKRIVFDAER